MEIVETNAEGVVKNTRLALGLPDAMTGIVDDVLLAALLRRAAGIHCPCSPSTLASSVLESLQHLTLDQESTSSRTESVLDSLLVGGDLLELNQVTIDDSTVRATWVFAAPPAFVVRPSGSVFLTGVVPDHDVFLPRSLAQRVVYQGCVRVIIPEPNEDLIGELREFGLHELAERTWLKSPKPETAENMLNGMMRRLASQPPSGTIEDLQILDPERPVTYYTGRWITPKKQTGTFMARRPQAYGAPIWCFVALEDGSAVKLLDLPLLGMRWRGCDVAWHLQMAIDRCRKVPQLYRRQCLNDGIRLDFFSPLPLWAQRRLMVFGVPVPREKSLMSYHLSAVEAETEESFLGEHLWLARSEDSN
jgi:hypothetical protein